MLQEAMDPAFAGADQQQTFDFTDGDPDGAGGAADVKDQNRQVEVDEPYAKLRLPPGIAADQRDVTASVVNLPTAPWPLEGAEGCTSRFQIPAMPTLATEYNGAQLPDTCFLQPGTIDGYFHVYLIGDWGGLPGPFGWNGSMKAPAPADHRSPEFPSHERNFIWGADDSAQRNIAEQMAKRAAQNPPDYILNVGDNFYWGGINTKCGGAPSSVDDATTQWQKVFEDVYVGTGIDDKQWLGVLGNHDFGGFMFVGGWDQAIHYTWMTNAPSTGRWVTPSLYYASKVVYPDFAIDYLFVDTNHWDTWLPHAEERHNLCSRNHNPPNAEATCGRVGPISADECPDWFKSLWEANVAWMEAALSASVAEWQIIVTHFPPEGEWGGEEWTRLSSEHGIDLILAGHRHRQEMHTDSHLSPTTYVVSGGGGGITSENEPDANGEDDEYGFVDLTLSATEIMLEMLSHGGQIRSTTCVTPRQRGATAPDALVTNSLCEGRDLGIQPLVKDAEVPTVAVAAQEPMMDQSIPPGPPPMTAPEEVAGQPVYDPNTMQTPVYQVPEAAPEPPPPPPPTGFLGKIKMLLGRFR